jgi:hypothetical protein
MDRIACRRRGVSASGRKGLSLLIVLVVVLVLGLQMAKKSRRTTRRIGEKDAEIS